MKTPTPFDPADIESLMLHKTFAELSDEEREFALLHIGSAEEYDSMRRVITELYTTSPGDDWLDPEPSIRENVLALFAREERKGFRIWLNSFFASLSPDQPSWYRRPAFQLAFAGIAVIGAIILFWPDEFGERLADNRSPQPVKEEASGTLEEPEEGDSILPAAPGEIQAISAPITEDQTPVTRDIDAKKEMESEALSDEALDKVAPSAQPSAVTSTGSTGVVADHAVKSIDRNSVKDAADNDEPAENAAFDYSSLTLGQEETLESTGNIDVLSSAPRKSSATLAMKPMVMPTASLAELSGMLDVLFTAR